MEMIFQDMNFEASVHQPKISYQQHHQQLKFQSSSFHFFGDLALIQNVLPFLLSTVLEASSDPKT